MLLHFALLRLKVIQASSLLNRFDETIWVLVEIFQLRATFQTTVVPCLRFILSHRFQWPKEDLNCEPPTGNIVTQPTRELSCMQLLFRLSKMAIYQSFALCNGLKILYRNCKRNDITCHSFFILLTSIPDNSFKSIKDNFQVKKGFKRWKLIIPSPSHLPPHVLILLVTTLETLLWFDNGQSYLLGKCMKSGLQSDVHSI